MTTFYIHLCWFVIFFLISIFFLLVSLFITAFSLSFSISIDLFSSWFLNFSFSISIDLFSTWFSFVVTLISSIIMVYSYFYMSPYSNVNYFIWLTIFFVLSMLAVINFSNFFFIMLGWDGLGLVSFFLIVYYQNSSSIYSGLFTVLINRVGDCFFIVSISIMLLYSPIFWVSHINSFFLSLFIVLTFMTKSAIYPFSPWLPIAMAAPTPISALVHSSTLVTAGLYLIMRFSYSMYLNPGLISFLLVLCVFTSFYAGLNAIFETDINNLIALSTLSHLGFIGMAFSCGLLYLSFFHLLVHALFNSVLFIAMGDIITNLFHSQDIRFLSSGLNFTPSSLFVMLVSFLNLLGFPSMSGFFSKDLVLETLNFTPSSLFVSAVVYLNLFFTYYYTLQLFFYSFSGVNFSPFSLIHPSSLTHSLILIILCVISVCFGFFWVNFVNFYCLHICVPHILNHFPILLELTIVVFLCLNLRLFIFNSSFISFYFSNIMFLSCFIITIISNLYLSSSFSMLNSFELGFFNGLINSSSSLFLFNFSSTSLKTLIVNPTLLIVFFSGLTIPMFFLC